MGKSNIRTNTFLAGKDDRKECKDCNKEITDMNHIMYEGLCPDCWNELGLSVDTLKTKEEIMDKIMGSHRR